MKIYFKHSDELFKSLFRFVAALNPSTSLLALHLPTHTLKSNICTYIMIHRPTISGWKYTLFIKVKIRFRMISLSKQRSCSANKISTKLPKIWQHISCKCWKVYTTCFYHNFLCIFRTLPYVWILCLFSVKYHFIIPKWTKKSLKNYIISCFKEKNPRYYT
jgi:hypothetical protein